MPLSEFLRMARGKLESGQQKTSPKDISSRVESDLVELVWENGQLLMQGQSSRTTRTSTVHSLPSNSLRFRDVGVGNSTVSRIGKFGEIETVLDDISPVVSSGELDMSQDDVIAPWLNFPLEDTMPHDYCSEVLPEISGVTANEISVQHSIVSVDKSCSDNHTVSNLHGTGIGLKGLSSKARLPNWPPLQGQASESSLGSRFSDVISNSSSLQPDILSGNSAQDRNLTNDSASTKMEWPDFKLPNNNVLNFSHFSRPTFLVKTKTRIYDALPTAVSSGVETMEDQDKVSVSSSVHDERLSSSLKGTSFHVQPAICVMGNSTNIAEAPKKAVPAEITEKICQVPPIKNDNPIVQSNSSSMMKEVGDSKNIIESMVASSSVGSDNCTDTVSCEKRHKNKRKFLDIEESDCHSDGVQTEGVGAKRAASVGGTGSKRSRAAEVHNLSERRRRDRINEKMRALQELIPNCNKADKASMLDEAIEYLKTLQLQVQIMSMGTGLYVPPVMFPPGIQHMHPPHIPHFSPMGMSMGMAMGYGTSMLDMNGGRTLGFPIFPVPPMQAAQFPHPMSGPSHFPRIPGHNFAVYGFPSQGIQNSGPGVPLIPLSRPPMDSAMGFRNSRIGKHDEELRTSSNLNSGNPLTHNNCQIMGNAEASCSRNTESTQLPTKTNVLDKPSVVQDNEQPTDGGAASSCHSCHK